MSVYVCLGVGVVLAHAFISPYTSNYYLYLPIHHASTHAPAAAHPTDVGGYCVDELLLQAGDAQLAVQQGVEQQDLLPVMDKWIGQL
jgi:hypothetical protein